MTRKDYTGKKFGHITITGMSYGYKVNPDSPPRTFCSGVCDCGNEVFVQLSNLRRGEPSCWECAHKKTGETHRREHIGNKYGHLTVYDIVYGHKVNENSRPRTYVKCTCDCGNDVFIPSDKLYKKDASCMECALKRRAKCFETDERGMKFGRLTIIDIDRSVRPSVAICECECGNVVRINKTDVVNGHTLSCGCLHKERTAESNTKDYSGYVSPYGVEILDKTKKNEHGTWEYNCKCPLCGKIFQSIPCKIIEGSVTSCGCKRESSGEQLIAYILDINQIDYEKQKRFLECKNIYTLPFDFAIIKNGHVFGLIEYDGKQHEESVDFFGGQEAFLCRKRNDEIKNDFCKENNIPLLRLTHKDTEQEIENKILSFCNP